MRYKCPNCVFTYYMYNHHSRVLHKQVFQLGITCKWLTVQRSPHISPRIIYTYFHMLWRSSHSASTPLSLRCLSAVVGPCTGTLCAHSLRQMPQMCSTYTQIYSTQTIPPDLYTCIYSPAYITHCAWGSSFRASCMTYGLVACS